MGLGGVGVVNPTSPPFCTPGVTPTCRYMPHLQAGENDQVGRETSGGDLRG